MIKFVLKVDIYMDSMSKYCKNFVVSLRTLMMTASKLLKASFSFSPSSWVKVRKRQGKVGLTNTTN